MAAIAAAAGLSLNSGVVTHPAVPRKRLTGDPRGFPAAVRLLWKAALAMGELWKGVINTLGLWLLSDTCPLTPTGVLEAGLEGRLLGEGPSSAPLWSIAVLRWLSVGARQTVGALELPKDSRKKIKATNACSRKTLLSSLTGLRRGFTQVHPWPWAGVEFKVIISHWTIAIFKTSFMAPDFLWSSGLKKKHLVYLK